LAKDKVGGAGVDEGGYVLGNNIGVGLLIEGEEVDEVGLADGMNIK
jgi:hypothetical protein